MSFTACKGSDEIPRPIGTIELAGERAHFDTKVSRPAGTKRLSSYEAEAILAPVLITSHNETAAVEG